eukprot:scaffold27268_cov110-Isochrysis_galbana.AAC.6
MPGQMRSRSHLVGATDGTPSLCHTPSVDLPSRKARASHTGNLAGGRAARSEPAPPSRPVSSPAASSVMRARSTGCGRAVPCQKQSDVAARGGAAASRASRTAPRCVASKGSSSTQPPASSERKIHSARTTHTDREAAAK